MMFASSNPQIYGDFQSQTCESVIPALDLPPHGRTTAQLSPRGSTAQKFPLSGLFKGLKAKGDDEFIPQVLVMRPGEYQTLLPPRGPTSDPHHHPCPGGAPVRNTGSEDGSGSSSAAPKATGQGGHRLLQWVKAAQRTGRTIPGAHRAFSFLWGPRQLGLGRPPGSFWKLLKQARGRASEGNSAVLLAPESPKAQASNVTGATHRSNLSGFPRPCSVVLPGGP
ncbi:uncharacterized protein LOC117975002 [Pan paniscus]|uniref:uncharacterized protein LOC117975002 n=1 Tax=Pan paniscus TaxID=9597 RepID=UPI00155F7D0E|nr:uncharacterized protein LOC117975002 [Pan paniscus]XP_054970280.1 uncharacterized protein LOC129398071 [Pan paniscus]XP_054970345.1 uncharacterized protein LOC129398076 [Pan paniscus]